MGGELVGGLTPSRSPAQHGNRNILRFCGVCLAGVDAAAPRDYLKRFHLR